MVVHGPVQASVPGPASLGPAPGRLSRRVANRDRGTRSLHWARGSDSPWAIKFKSAEPLQPGSYLTESKSPDSDASHDPAAAPPAGAPARRLAAAYNCVHGDPHSSSWPCGFAAPRGPAPPDLAAPHRRLSRAEAVTVTAHTVTRRPTGNSRRH